jgi:hypothetical protein
VLLETTDESLIDDKTIRYIGQLGDYLLVADARKCFLFTLMGEFIRTIGQQGRGPGEYSHILRVNIDNKTQRIYITGDAQRVYEYDINGKFIETILPDNRFDGFVFMEYGNILVDLPNSYGDNPDMLALLSRSGDTLSKIPNYDIFELISVRGLVFSHHPFDHYDGRINYYRMFNDTIFTVQVQRTTLSLSPKYILDVGSRAFPMALRQNMFINNHGEYNFEWLLPMGIMEMGNCFFVRALWNKYPLGSIYYMYNKHEETFFMIGRPNNGARVGLNDDIDGGLPFLPQFKIDEQRLCMFISAHVVVDYMKDNPQFSPPGFDKLTYDENPVIVIANLR